MKTIHTLIFSTVTVRSPKNRPSFSMRNRRDIGFEVMRILYVYEHNFQRIPMYLILRLDFVYQSETGNSLIE